MLFLLATAWPALCLGTAERIQPLGVVYASEEAFFDLVYRNEGPAPLPIRQVRTTCDCLTIIDHPATVAAGATIRLPCVYRSAKPGSIQVEVEIIIGASQETAAARFKVSGFAAEKSWLISAAEAVALSPGAAVFVDTREPAEFARAHLARALNLPVFALKTHGELRSRRVVLMDEGASPQALLSEAQALRAQGFDDVAVLVGGLPAWSRAGGMVEGTDQSAVRLARISAARLAAAQAASPWLVLELGRPDAPEEPTAGSSPVHDLGALEAKLAAWTPPVAGGLDFRPVVILTDRPQDQAAIERRLGRGGSPLYYLEGGREAWVAHQARQAALGRHTGQTFVAKSVVSPTLSRRCGTCGK